MNIESLKNILQPPKSPYNIGNAEEWQKFEDRLGSQLPSDYKCFISVYGSGSIDDFLWFLVPFVKEKNVCFLKRYKIINEAYEVTRQKFPKLYKHKVFPESEGILPWAYTDNGDILYWLTKGESHDWPIVIYDSRSPDFVIYDKSVLEFLYELLNRELVCEIFPDDFPRLSPEFISISIAGDGGGVTPPYRSTSRW